MTTQTGAKHTPEEPLYYAEKNVVRKRPVETKHDNGTSSVALGFPICVMHEACEGQAEALAELLNLGAAYPTLIASVEAIERFLGISGGPSGLEQIARDIKSGTFPKKSEQTLAEEAEASRLHNLIKDSIKAGAPGLSDATCGAIAQSVALKIRHAVSSLPTAQVKT